MIKSKWSVSSLLLSKLSLGALYNPRTPNKQQEETLSRTKLIWGDPHMEGGREEKKGTQISITYLI